jgi:hypothetical protein
MMAETDHVAQFDAWVEGFISHVALKGIVAVKDDERAAKSTTNV